MKTRSYTTKQNFLLNSLSLTAIFLFGSSQVSEFSLAQPTPSKPILNTAAYTYIDIASGAVFQGVSAQLQLNAGASGNILIDPFGALTSCSGDLLADYTGLVLACMKYSMPLAILVYLSQ